MAAAVQTNLSVAFTHGIQLTMGHCQTVIHSSPTCPYSRWPSKSLHVYVWRNVLKCLMCFYWADVSLAWPGQSNLGLCRSIWVCFCAYSIHRCTVFM